jgi:hypothetical protein
LDASQEIQKLWESILFEYTALVNVLKLKYQLENHERQKGKFI